MSKRLDILGARIFGASVCYARKYLQPFRKCPNVWTKSPDLAIMHKHKPHIIRTKACICAFCYFVDFLHTFLDIFITNIIDIKIPEYALLICSGTVFLPLGKSNSTYPGYIHTPAKMLVSVSIIFYFLFHRKQFPMK